MLQQVRRGLADVATSRKRIELQATQLQQSATKLQDQARQAMEQNREDLAREALTRRAAIATQLQELEVQHTQLQGQEAKLTDALRRLEAKGRVLPYPEGNDQGHLHRRSGRDQDRRGRLGHLRGDGRLGMSMQRAQDKVAQMQARAGAVDELLASGALNDLTTTSDPIQAELDRVSATSGVDAELARLKGKLGSGGAPAPALPAGGSGSPVQS